MKEKSVAAHCGVAMLLLAILSMTGCAVMQAYWDWSSYYARVPENRVFPKKPKFTVLPKRLDSSSPLKTDGVYYAWIRRPPESPPKCQYMRFWPDGRVYGGYVTSRPPLPLSQDADSLCGVRMGFYQARGTNICVELYLPDIYTAMFGSICDDVIAFNCQTSRTDSGFTEFSDKFSARFEFLPLTGMKKQPDWSPTGMLYQAVVPYGK